MTAPVTIVVLLVTGLASFVAFQRPDLKDRWIFDPKAILADKQYDRMVMSGLIHADWVHFGFNAFSFFSFGQNIELIYGAWTLLLVYGSSILGGSLLSLFIHRHHDYRALGASGGVCGVIFASIFLLPGSSITMFPLPIGIPASVYAVLFLIGSFVAHRSRSDNIGHDAHLGGAIVGLLVATGLYPTWVLAEPWMFAAVLGLSLIILFALIINPIHLSGWRIVRADSPAGDERSRRYEQNRARNKRLARMDELLDKVSQGGIQGLSLTERKELDRLSKELYRKE